MEISVFIKALGDYIFGEGNAINPNVYSMKDFINQCNTLYKIIIVIITLLILFVITLMVIVIYPSGYVTYKFKKMCHNIRKGSK